MSSIYQGEIYLVAFSPSVGHEYRKIRPALIVAADDIIKRSPLIICCPITSKNTQPAAMDDVRLAKDPSNKLTRDSLIKMQHVYTFDKSRIHKYIGYADAGTMKAIKNKLRLVFGL